MNKKFFLSILCLISFHIYSSAQNVEIDNYSVNNLGQVQLSIQAEAGKYYVLHAQHSPTFNWAVSITIGVNGTMIISESGAAYPLENYTITEHDMGNPDDYDGDGIDDITEFNNMPTDGPLNFAEAIDFIDGATSIPDAETFMSLATVNNVGWAPFLDDQLYVKFGILDRDTSEPKVYFINSNTYTIHASFWNGIDATVNGDDSSGEIVFNPNDILPSGIIGTYSFNFSFGDAYNFEDTQRTYELLAASMPFLQNNMNHFIGQSSENNHINNYAEDFIDSRIDVVLETDVFAEVNYVPFHEAEGYGFFRHMQDLNETPGSRDIVLYDALPNSLPRVGGIITSVMQTPLSHVNLRAIQDNVPNAYIADPLSNNAISSLLGNYIYYKVESEQFEIREATLAEVNEWYEDLRPTEPQIPIRDLSITDIVPLDDIEFEMSTAFGAKCSNVATMRDFGFPEGTIPDGFGIPFYYYDEFMQFNNFYQEAQVILENPVFHNDINFRVERLKLFREDIKAAPMPQWMLDDLQAMHDGFPEGTAVRVRSSTNNEDLPGFSGAGLYTSKTQYPDEGHISKSIKQVYASMWNFRAYEERDFYRVDHFMAAMGVLCHLSFQNEQSNGVGISIDPIYDTEDTFYLNTQVGESLITNPEANSVPEEILLYEDPNQGGGYLVLRLSNLVNPGELVMDQVYLDQMREYLSIIHDEFAILYDVVGAEGFAMDIEYKVTEEGQLIIKQARPWVSFWADITSDYDLGVSAIASPQSSSSLGSEELVTTTISNNGLNDMTDFNIELLVDGQLMETIIIDQTIEPFSEADYQFSVPQDFSNIGDYTVTSIVNHINDEYENNDTLSVVLRKVHLLNGEISLGELEVVCDDIVEAEAIVYNHGEETITELEIEVIVNDLSVNIIDAEVNIPFEQEGIVTIAIDDNLQQNNNITLNLLDINGQQDEDLSNNSATTSASLDSNYDIITLLINADDYPQETSWKLLDESNQIIAAGALDNDTEVFTEDICVDYSSCFSLYVYDSYGDGICCGYGFGDFLIMDSSDNIVLSNNGEFNNFVQEVFCLDESGCEITADINISPANSTFANDGAITINTNSGLSPFQYSIDNGQTFFDSNTFSDLTPGDYDVFVMGATGICTFEETVSVGACDFTSVNIVATTASSVVSTDGSIVITPTSGEGPYLYSIDGGQSFDTNNVFSGLPIGTYNIVVQDSAQICFYEESVPLRIETMVINEINYRSIDSFNPDDWIELYNPESTVKDISNWKIKDDNDSHVFVIPEGTQVEANGYLIIVKDEADFTTAFPGIPYIGELGFGFGGSDEVRLYTSDDKLVDEVKYESESPWPTCAYETGNTLELITPELDNSLPESWNCINENGSPNAVNSSGLYIENVTYSLLKIFPNPVKNSLYISGDTSSYNIKIYSLLGQLVMAASNVDEVDVSSFAKGVYLIKISNESSTTTKRFIKL
ncbi:lamin tail domain-containing protein [Flavobacteriaceae bacterium]|nr:lamin tail domain-containing protein [Flavobacteriaceae bacterium]